MRLPRFRWMSTVAAMALSAGLLIACGGGGGGGTDTSSNAQTPANPAPATISMLDGTITGFGSVVIDGVRYDDSQARVGFAKMADASTAGTLADLRTGMRVQADVKDGVLQALTVNFALVGTVGAVDATAGTVTVFGQTIQTVASGQLPTVFDGFTALGQLAIGDLIRVYGTVGSDGRITATRIERKAKNGGTEVFRLSGAIQSLDSTNKRFGLQGNSGVVVDYSQANVLPTGAVLENNKLVSVISLSAPTTTGGQTVLAAKQVEVKAKKLPDGNGVSVGGVISAFQSLASMRIGDVQVDASNAKLTEGTSAADVVNGALALAQGKVSNGVLAADTLKVFKQDTAIKALLVGQVTDYVSPANFSVRGTVVDGSQASFTKGQASDLAVGTWVQITGSLSASGVLAKEISVTPPPSDKPAKLAGAIGGLDSTAKQFTLLGVKVQWSDSTKFSPDGKSAAQLANGGMVAVEGSYSASSGAFNATSIAFLQPVTGLKTVGFSGLAYDVGASSFKVGSNTVQITNTTQFESKTNSAADLVNGVRVSVVAQVSSANGSVTLSAVKVEIEGDKDDQGRDLAYVTGLITDYASAASFRVGGQWVDASGSGVQWVDGNASKLANGAKVEVKGTVQNGVLVAVKLHFLPG